MILLKGLMRGAHACEGLSNSSKIRQEPAKGWGTTWPTKRAVATPWSAQAFVDVPLGHIAYEVSPGRKIRRWQTSLNMPAIRAAAPHVTPKLFLRLDPPTIRARAPLAEEAAHPRSVVLAKRAAWAPERGRTTWPRW
jgi:hypothetical protein